MFKNGLQKNAIYCYGIRGVYWFVVKEFSIMHNCYATSCLFVTIYILKTQQQTEKNKACRFPA